MKRLAFWMVAGGLALIYAESRGLLGGEDVRRSATVATLATFDDPPVPPPPPQPPAPKKAGRRRPPQPPRPEAPAVVEAKTQPDWFPRDRDGDRTADRPGVVGAGRPDADAQGRVVVVGAISASEEKARRDLARKIDAEVARWLVGDVPTGWTPPRDAVDRLVLATYVQPVIESLGDVSKDLDEMVTLYRAGARIDLSPARRSSILALREAQVVRERMLKGAGALAVVLVGLAAFSGYIRADEATKGYYTNRLRMLAAVGVGAAGVAAYRLLA